MSVIDDAIAESCSECMATPGKGCRSRSDRPCGPHVVRHQAATRRRVREREQAAPKVELCPSCGVQINPATGECRCSA